jgi:hypothetical protein
VAKSYREILAGQHFVDRAGNKFVPEAYPAAQKAEDYLSLHGGDFDKARATLTERLNDWKGADTAHGRNQEAMWSKSLDVLDQMKEQGLRRPGHTYEVAIHADPERFINWDAPLSQQHPDVRRAIKDAPVDPDMKRTIRQIADESLTGPGVYHAPLGIGARNSAPATQFWNEAGIPGIKYLDQGSRAAGDGSRNYVTFSDKIVEIMRKYGVASFAALPPAVQMMLQHGAEPGGNKLTAEPAS